MPIYVITEDHGYDGACSTTVDCTAAELELIRKNFESSGVITIERLDEWVTKHRMPESAFNKLTSARPKRGIWWVAVNDLCKPFTLEDWSSISQAMSKLNQVKHFHVTLAYDVTEQDRPEGRYASKFDAFGVKIGEYTPIYVHGLAYNDKCACLVVHGMGECCNKHPHITLATADGVPPVYSNDMLSGKDGPYSFLPLEAELEGTPEFFQFK